MYAYLQKGEDDLAKKQWDYLNTIDNVYPANFKVAYAFAAVPSRYVLEKKLWEDAARLQVHQANFAWKDFQWQEGIIHFTRLMGLIHTGKIDSAKAELQRLNLIHDALVQQKDPYKAGQVQIQIKASEGWIKYKERKGGEALTLMNLAADMEDGTEKHPVTPCEVIPARELLGDLLLQMNKPAEALAAYEADLKRHPGRFNGLYGAGLAAERSGDQGKAGAYYRQLLAIAGPANKARPEPAAANNFLKGH